MSGAWPPGLPDQSGRVALVTGANTGIGKITAQELARAGARVFLGCRSEARASAAIDDIRAEVPDADVVFHPLDLGSVASATASAQAFLELGEPLHMLVNNAGLVARGLSPDGFEATFAVNHIGHSALTLALLDRVVESAPARVVTVASRGHYRARHIDFEALRRRTATVTGFDEYCVSKLANILFSAELARRLEGTGVTTYAVHPGDIASDIWRDIPWPVRWIVLRFLKSVEEGARTQLHCATAPELAEHTGRYYHDSAEKRPSSLARDPALAAELWRRTEAWLAESTPPTRESP